MKKIVYILSIMVLVLSTAFFVSCGDDEKPENHEHRYTSSVTREPTCTVDGEKTLTCSCNDVKTELIPATGHDWKDATCTTLKTCRSCGISEGNEYAHKDSDVNGRCDECNKLMADHCIHSAGTYTEKSIKQTATCVSIGIETIYYRCNTCDKFMGEKSEVIIPEMGHNYGPWTQTEAPTCTVAGKESAKCQRCSYVNVRPIFATGHKYSNGICTACGANSGASADITNFFTASSAINLLNEVEEFAGKMDLGAILSQYSLYADLPALNGSLSVRDGYITISENNTVNQYIGINNGYMLYVKNDKIDTSIPLIPMYEINEYNNILKEYIIEFDKAGMTPKLTDNDFSYQEGWYYLTDAAISRLAKEVFALIYSFDYGTEPSDDIIQMINSTVDAIIVNAAPKLGFTMSGEYINGITASVTLPDISKCFEGAEGKFIASAEIRFSPDFKCIDYIKAKIDADIPEEEMYANADVEIVTVHNGDGSFVMSGNVKNCDAGIDGMQIVANDIRFKLGFTADYLPAVIEISGKSITKNIYLEGITVYDYVENYNNGGYGWRPYNWSARVNSYADLVIEVDIAADIAALRNGSANVEAKITSKTENARIEVGRIYGYTINPNKDYYGNEINVTEDQVLAKLSNYDKNALLLYAGNGNFSAEATLDAKDNKGTLSFLMTKADGIMAGFNADFELNSSNAELPPLEIRELIDNYLEAVKSEKTSDEIIKQIEDFSKVFNIQYKTYDQSMLDEFENYYGWKLEALIDAYNENSNSFITLYKCSTDPKTKNEMIKEFLRELADNREYMLKFIVVELKDGVIVGSRDFVKQFIGDFDFCTNHGSNIKTEEKIIVNPTCTALGEKEIITRCASCNEVIDITKETMQVIAHIEKTLQAVAPTCITNGSTEGKVCSVCGYEMVKVQSVPTVGHTYKDGVCTLCGINSSSVSDVIGFFTADSAQNLVDAIEAFVGRMDLGAVLAQFNLYSEVPALGGSLSVKDGYITIKEDGHDDQYIGINQGYAVYLRGDKIKEEIPLIPMDMIEYIAGGLQDYITYLDQSGKITTITSNDISYQEGWYYLTEPAILRLAKEIAYFVYELDYGTEASDDVKRKINDTVDSIVANAAPKLGFTMSGEYINGITASVTLPDISKCFEGTEGKFIASAEIRFSPDFKCIDYIKAKIDADIPEEEMYANADVEIVTVHNDDGSFVMNGIVKNCKLGAEGMDITSSNVEFKLGFTADYLPALIELSGKAYMNNVCVDNILVYDYLENYNNGGYGWRPYNWCAWVNSYADLEIEVDISADIAGLRSGNANIDAKITCKSENARIEVGRIYGYTINPNKDYYGNEINVTEDQVLAKLSDYDIERLIDTYDLNGSAQAKMNATDNVGTIVVTMIDADGFVGGFTVSFELNSEKAVMPSPEIQDLINSYREVIKSEKTSDQVIKQIEEYSKAFGVQYDICDREMLDEYEVSYGWKLDDLIYASNANHDSYLELYKCSEDLKTKEKIKQKFIEMAIRYPYFWSDYVIVELEDGLIIGDKDFIKLFM